MAKRPHTDTDPATRAPGRADEQHGGDEVFDLDDVIGDPDDLEDDHEVHYHDAEEDGNPMP